MSLVRRSRDSVAISFRFCMLLAAILLPVQTSSAQSRGHDVALAGQVRQASRIDLYEVYPYRETRGNIRSSDIRSIACTKSLQRGDPGWAVIEKALDGARMTSDPARQVGAIDLRLGIVLANGSGEMSSLYFVDNLVGRPPALPGELDSRSVLVPAALAVAIHQVMGSLERDCRTRR